MLSTTFFVLPLAERPSPRYFNNLSIHSRCSFYNLFDETASWFHSITFETIPEIFTYYLQKNTARKNKSHTPLFENFPTDLRFLETWGYFTNQWQYAITNPSPDAGLVHQNGDLSPLGRVYVNLGQNRRLNPVNGTSEETESAKYTETEPIFAWEIWWQKCRRQRNSWTLNFCWLHGFTYEVRIYNGLHGLVTQAWWHCFLAFSIVCYSFVHFGGCLHGRTRRQDNSETKEFDSFAI